MRTQPSTGRVRRYVMAADVVASALVIGIGVFAMSAVPLILHNTISF